MVELLLHKRLVLPCRVSEVGGCLSGRPAPLFLLVCPAFTLLSSGLGAFCFCLVALLTEHRALSLGSKALLFQSHGPGRDVRL